MSDQTKDKVAVIVGGSGFIGARLGLSLLKNGFKIRLVSRSIKPRSYYAYKCEQFVYDGSFKSLLRPFDGADVVINLAGESLASGRWSRAKKQRILDSRVEVSQNVSRAVNELQVPLLVATSAIGYYGSRKDELITESSTKGTGFLSDVCEGWENAVRINELHTRLVIMRVGVVLDTTGGALLEMMTPYLCGVGAKISNGDHYLGWIHHEDLCNFVIRATENNSVKGVYNLTSPTPSTYLELHQALLKSLGGSVPGGVPSFVFRLLLGEKAAMVLDSQRVVPEKLLKEGFEFKFKNISDGLENLLGSDYVGCAVKHEYQWLDSPLDEVWEFFSTEKNLEKLTPKSLKFQVKGMTTPTIEKGSLITYKLKIHGVPVKWVTKITSFTERETFSDVQLKGPYTTWDHTHNFESLEGGTLMEDKVRFKLPLGRIGAMAAFLFVKKDVDTIFQFRRDEVCKIFKD